MAIEGELLSGIQELQQASDLDIAIRDFSTRSHLGPHLVRLAAADMACDTLWEQNATVITGNLQTDTYQEGLLRAIGFDPQEPGLKAAQQLRVERRALLDKPGRNTVLVLGEGALRGNVGGPGIMAEQLGYLLDRASELGEDKLDIHVAPFKYGPTVLGNAHMALKRETADGTPAPFLAYEELPMYMDRENCSIVPAENLGLMARTLQGAYDRALPYEDSLRMIREIRHEYLRAI